MPPPAVNTLGWAPPCPLHPCAAAAPRGVCVGRGVTAPPRTGRGVTAPPRTGRRWSVPRRMRASCSVEHPPKRKPADHAMSSAAQGNGLADSEVPVSPRAEAAPENNSVGDFVHLENISHSYGGRKILDGLNLTLRYGEGTAIIGPSGTGKSTTLRLICGLELPDEGQVTVKGYERKAPLKDEFGPVKVSMVFQQSALFDSLTVCENVGFELFEHTSLPDSRILSLVEAALARVGLFGVMDKYPRELSGGMRKRVSFARAVLYDPDNISSAPELILFDEPSSALDPTSTTRIENCIRELQVVCPTYVVVTHELSTIRRTADRVVFLHDGRVQWDGSVEEIDTTDNPFMVQFMTASLEGPLAAAQDFAGFEGEVENEVVGETDL